MKKDIKITDREWQNNNSKSFLSPQLPDRKIMGVHQRFPWLVYAGCGLSIFLVIVVGGTSYHR